MSELKTRIEKMYERYAMLVHNLAAQGRGVPPAAIKPTLCFDAAGINQIVLCLEYTDDSGDVKLVPLAVVLTSEQADGLNPVVDSTDYLHHNFTSMLFHDLADNPEQMDEDLVRYFRDKPHTKKFADIHKGLNNIVDELATQALT